MINNFINKIQNEFGIHLILSQEPLQGKNTYDIDESGNVKNLVLKNFKLKNLEAILPVAISLKELSIERCKLENLELLKFFSGLSKLTLNYNPFPSKDIENVKFLENLKCLELRGTNIEDTRVLQDLQHLEILDISGADHLFEVRGLEKLDSLKHLELEFNQIDRIEKISAHENLKSLNLRSGEIHHISGLDKFPNLTSLDLSSNPIAKIEELDQLKQLENLNISTTWVTKIEGLNQLIFLETLNLHNQEIQKIEGLDYLINLKRLNLSENKIQRVENLDNLTNLEYLLLECNEIREFDSVFLKNLHSPCTVSLVGNPIKEINGHVPDYVKIQFEDPNWTPKSL
ncbi:Internalin-A precursor [compost metagenome]